MRPSIIPRLAARIAPLAIRRQPTITAANVAPVIRIRAISAMRSFSHSTIGGTDCSACHTPPANHYGGECRACHQDTGNFRNATFNHSTIGGTDCSACHSAPANHYPGACTACHTDTGNFRNVNFNHAGLTDCQSCHSRPSNHFQGQCSDCHTTNSWGGASFNHSFPINHKGANGECTKCHSGGDTSILYLRRLWLS